MNENWTLYADAGVSYIAVESDIQVNGMDTPLEIANDLGWYAGLGVAVGTTVQGFLEAQFRTFTWEADDDSLPPGTPTPEDIELDHIAVNAGIRITW